MLTIDADNFVSFLENSNALFGIFPDNSVQPIIYLASQTDTIKNIGLNQLGEKLEDKKCRTFFSIRITAEEESTVFSSKKKGEEFLLETIKWSSNF